MRVRPSPTGTHQCHRATGPAQLAADLSHRRPAGQAPGDGLPLRQRQRETGPLASRRGDPACPRHLIPHDLGDPAQRPTDGIQRFPASPPAPQFRLLRDAGIAMATLPVTTELQQRRAQRALRWQPDTLDRMTSMRPSSECPTEDGVRRSFATTRSESSLCLSRRARTA